MKPIEINFLDDDTAYKLNDTNVGVQLVFEFKNGYRASIVKHGFSYGGKEGLWELAVMRFERPHPILLFRENTPNWQIVYDTPITNDVIGNLTRADYMEILKQIEVLPPHTEAARSQ